MRTKSVCELEGGKINARIHIGMYPKNGFKVYSDFGYKGGGIHIIQKDDKRGRSGEISKYHMNIGSIQKME